jgi:hypothetical protein
VFARARFCCSAIAGSANGSLPRARSQGENPAALCGAKDWCLGDEKETAEKKKKKKLEAMFP